MQNGMESDLPKAEAFIQFMKMEETKQLARILVKFAQIAALKSLVNVESTECQTEYALWISQLKLERKKNKDGPSKLPNPPTRKTTFRAVLNSMDCDQKRHLLSFLVEANQWATCEKILESQSEETKRLFDRWKIETFGGKPECAKMFMDKPMNEPPDCSDDDDDDLTPYDKVSPDLFKEFGKETNILLLGETGVGKTTFINALANYLCSSTVDEAKRNPIILTRAHITYTDAEFETHKIVCQPTVPLPAEEIENERSTWGNSITQKPKIYSFTIGSEPNKKTIRIIDTPGVADANVLQDQTNYRNVMRIIAQHMEIKAILILMNSNEERLSNQFKFSLNEIFQLFSASAKNNILFCFTKSREANFSLGESFRLLEKYLKDKRTENRNMEVKLENSILYRFENDSFRYICLANNGIEFTKDEVEMFNSSWKLSAAEAFRMFGKIASMPPHEVNETLINFKISSILTIFAKPLVNIRKEYKMNILLLEEAIQNYNDYRNKGKKINKFYEQLTQEIVRFPEPRTVCNSPTCSKRTIKKSNITEAGYQEVYEKSICHKNCRPDYFKHEKDAIKYCQIFNNSQEGICRICKCSWTEHSHEMHETRWHKVKIENPYYITHNADIEQEKIDLTETIAIRRGQRDEHIKNEAEIQSLITDFALFLKARKNLTFNAEYTQQLEHEIKLAEKFGKYDLVNDLKAMLDEYQTTMKEFENVGGVNSRRIKSEVEILDDIEKLKKIHSHILPEIEEIEALKVIPNGDVGHNILSANAKATKTFR